MKTILKPQGLSMPLKPTYSHGVVFDIGTAKLVFVSGQIAEDENGKLIGRNDAKLQTRQVLENLCKVLSSAGATLDDVAKVTVYLLDMKDFDDVHQVRAEYFKHNLPASVLVQVKRLAKEGLLVEIDAIAVVSK